MSGAVTFSVTGFKEIEDLLADLPNRTRKAALVRGLKKALEPMRAAAEENAPKRTGHLGNAFTVDTRLNSNQARAARGTVKSTIEVYLGPTGDHGVWHYAVPEEFGWRDGRGHFALTRAYEAHKDEAVAILRVEALNEVERSLRRIGAL